MITFFPSIYPDELLYSVIGRYHQISGTNIKRTLNELFTKDRVIPVIDLPCHLQRLCDNLPEDLGYTPDYLIQYCTLFPIFSPFMDLKTREECIEIMKKSKGNKLKPRIGVIASKSTKKDDIFYCPICVKEELENSLEPYIHRLHQAEGVYICEKHRCKLHKYKRDTSRYQYTALDINELDYEPKFITDASLSDKHIRIVNEIKYLLNNDLSSVLDINTLKQKYLSLLDTRGYLTPAKIVKLSKLRKDFVNYYGIELLNNLNSSTSFLKMSWLDKLARRSFRFVHPLKHILFIIFLAGSIEKLISYRDEEKNIYPCLNKLCRDYRQSVRCLRTVKFNYSINEPVITIVCKSCGFTYTRSKSRDPYEIGQIKDYGFLWKEKLKNIIQSSNNKSIKYIAEEMGCSFRTVIRYADKLNLRHLLSSKAKSQIKSSSQYNTSTQVLEQRYKEAIITYIKNHPNVSITTIKQENSKEYQWLYSHKKEWLKQILPKPQKPKVSIRKVDWQQRDNEILLALKNEYYEVISRGKLVRITRSMLGKRCGRLHYIQQHLDKLPLSKSFLQSVEETVEDFQIRRVKAVCDKLVTNKEPLLEWKIKRLAGLNSVISLKVQEAIKANIAIHSSL